MTRGALSPSDVLRLQRAVGNRATGRLLAGLAARRAPAPSVQRDIAAANDFENGTLSIDMKPSMRESHADAYGEEGIIAFEPADDGETADSIELVQTVKVTRAGTDAQWDGEEGIREAWKADDGRFVDASGGERPAAWAGGAARSDAYNADLAAGAEAANAGPRFNGADGARREMDVQPGYHRANGQRKKTELWDHPSSPQPGTYAFETSVVARGGADAAERTWGSVRWGFQTVQTLPDGALPGALPDWSVAGETATFHAAASGSHTAARQRFAEVMGSTGTLAPANIAAAKDKFRAPATRDAGRADIDAIKARADVYLATLPADAGSWRDRLQALKTGLDNFMVGIEAEDADWAAAAVAAAPPKPPPGGGGGGSGQQDNVPDSWEDVVF